MSAQAVSKIMCFAVMAALFVSEPLKAQSGSSSSTEPESSAVDAKGIRHRPSNYGDKRAPWIVDRIKFVQPAYPVETRERHNQGTGVFRITLDVNTGSVTNVVVVKSTGFSILDDSAIKAIRLWRWRPGKWKEVEMPVAFTLGSRRHPAGLAEDLTGRGTAYYLKGDKASAIKAFDEAIRLHPTSVEPYIMRGSAYQLQGEREKGLADFSRAIELDPKSARAYCDRGVLRDDLRGQPNQALADYNKAIQFAPSFQRAYFNRATHYVGEHEYARAAADFTRAIQLVPNDLSAYAYRAYAHAKQGNRAQALADAKIAVKLKPSETPIAQTVDLALRAKAYRIAGQPDLALQDLREAVQAMPSNHAANDNLAWFLATYPDEHFRNGTEAISAAKKACELSQWQSSGCFDTLATAYAEAGEFDQAVKYAKQASTDSSIAPREREEREKRLALFQQRKPFRDEF